MQRIGGFQADQLDVGPTVGTDEHYHYRSKITPHYNAPRRPEQLHIGFQQRGSRHIVDIDQCVIATEAINAEYQNVRTDIAAEIGNIRDPQTCTRISLSISVWCCVILTLI